ncbi:MAG: radical SAM protein [Bacteroidota bacterium]
MKKVLLVNTNTETNPYPVPPLGICLLAQSIKHRYQVHVYDGVFDEGKKLSSVIQQFNPDYIGISIRNIDDMVMENPTCYTNPILENFVKLIKRESVAKIILGGSGFSIFPFELLRLFGADYGVVGESEEVFLTLLDSMDKNIPVFHIQGVINHSTNEDTFKHPEKNMNIDQLPFSDIDKHIDFNPYKSRSVYPIQTKRGCRHQCIYCTYPLIEGKTYQTRKPENIADEIEQAYERLGPVTFEFVDSTFNDPPGHAEAICKAIINKNIKVKLRTMGINPRHSSPELFELMLNAGFTQIDCTPDSASPVIIKNLKKGFSYNDLKYTAEIIKEFDLPAMWFFLFGGPGENERTINETFDFIDRYISQKDMVHLTCGLRIYPGTELHKIALKEKIITHVSESLLIPRFYLTTELAKDEMEQIFMEKLKTRPNCIPGSESKPDAAMLKQAFILRETLKTDEPMFRTLLRIRKQNFY